MVMFMTNESWSDINNDIWDDDFVDNIITKVPILDIFDRLKIQYIMCRSGVFTHKAKCPLPRHYNGNERTASLFISETSNSYYCYGCSSGTNIINFVSSYFGKPHYEAMMWIYNNFSLGNRNSSDIKRYDPTRNPSKYIIESGIEIREFLKKYNNGNCIKAQEWANKQFIELDKFLDDDNVDFDEVYSYYKKIQKFIARKMK